MCRNLSFFIMHRNRLFQFPEQVAHIDLGSYDAVKVLDPYPFLCHGVPVSDCHAMVIE